MRYRVPIMSQKENNVFPKYGNMTQEQKSATIVDGEINRHSQ